jgi:hypothetical protein
MWIGFIWLRIGTSGGSLVNTVRTIGLPAEGKNKAIPVTGRGGPYGCETSRLPHFLDNRLTDGGEDVSLNRRSPFIPQEDSWYSFLLEVWSTPGS